MTCLIDRVLSEAGMKLHTFLHMLGTFFVYTLALSMPIFKKKSLLRRFLEKSSKLFIVVTLLYILMYLGVCMSTISAWILTIFSRCSWNGTSCFKTENGTNTAILKGIVMDLKLQEMFPAIFAWGQYEDFASQIKWVPFLYQNKIQNWDKGLRTSVVPSPLSLV